MRWSPGRRMLAIVGLAEVAFAGYLLSEEIDPADVLLYALVPIVVQSAVWATIGALVITAATTRRHMSTAWGLLAIMPSIRAISYTWSTLMSAIPGSPDPDWTTAPAAVGWWCVTIGLITMLPLIPQER